MEIKLTFLTPAFLYGADQTKPEFRIASLIGQMRYWWRMTKDWSDIKRLRDEEAKIFGLSEKGAKPFYLWQIEQHLQEESAKEQNKKVSIPFDETFLPPNFNEMKTRDRNLCFEKGNNGWGKLIYKGFMQDTACNSLKNAFKGSEKKIVDLYEKSHRYVFDTDNMSGLSYLFYPFNQKADNVRFQWIKPDSYVVLKFDLLKEDIKNEVLLSLFLLSRFGGLGSRSRRGAGSIEIEAISDNCELFQLTEEDLQKYIGKEGENKNLNGHVYFSCVKADSMIYTAMKNYDQLKTNISSNRCWREPLGYLGKRMRDYRAVYGGNGASFRSDAKDLHAYASGIPAASYSGNNPLEKHAFGLPIIYNFSHSRRYIEATPNGENYERRASPLYISVNRNKGNNNHYATLLLLWDKFLPENKTIMLKVKERNGQNTINIKSTDTIQQPSWGKIIDFIRSC